jgi:zinc metalloprotease ZmpB
LDDNTVNSDANPNATLNGFGSIDCGYEQSTTGSSQNGPFCPVSIAADWRVTFHEFVHGMLFDRIHSGFLGFAHNGGDGFGAIYMDPGSKAPDRFLTFPWVLYLSDPVNEPGVLRRHDRPVSQGWAWGGT